MNDANLHATRARERSSATTPELRAMGRTLHGIAMTYGDVADPARAALSRAGSATAETFAPGSLHPAENVVLNVEHRGLVSVAWHPGGGLELNNDDQALRFTAKVPPTPAGEFVLSEVRAGRLSGVSVEFHAQQERRIGGTRVIDSAELTGLAVTRAPAYHATALEVRAQRRPWLSGRVPTDTQLDCRCVSPQRRVVFRPGAFDDVVEKVVENRTVILAHTRSHSPEHVLASTANDSLLISIINNVLAVEVAATAADTVAGRALAPTLDVAPPIARPIVDPDRSVYEDLDGVRYYETAWITSFLFKWTTHVFGWPALTISNPVPVGAPVATAPEPARRRLPAWL